MTLTEKILAARRGRKRGEAGENIWVQADILMTHDVCGPGKYREWFKREFGANAKVWDRHRVVIIPDHYIFFTAGLALEPETWIFAAVSSRSRTLPYFYDVIDDPAVVGSSIRARER